MFLNQMSGGNQGPDAAWEKIEQGALIIDVRSPAEFASGAVSGAKNVPLETIGQFAATLEDKSQALVVYCLSGGRSSAAASVFAAQGFSDITNGGGVQSMMAAQPA